MADRRSSRPLDAADWTQAALDAIADGGLAAVAIEPLAKRLGTTKGSFYWHFAHREALVHAALERWEHEHTEGVIALVDQEAEPGDRLLRLFELVLHGSRHDRIEMGLLAAAEHPWVEPVLRRATERRVDYVAEQYRALGCARSEARQRAVLAVSVYLGHVQLGRTAPSAIPDGEEWTEHLRGVRRALAVVEPQGTPGEPSSP